MLGNMLARGFLLKSLRLRLLAGTLAWISLTLVVAGWGLDQLFQRHMQQQFQAELNVHLNQLTAAFYVDQDGQPAVLNPLSDPRFQEPFSGLYWQVDQLAEAAEPAVNGLLRSRSLWDSALEGPDNPQGNTDELGRAMGPDGQPVMVLQRTVELPEDTVAPMRLMVAAQEALIAQPLGRFTRALLLSLGLLAVGLMLAAVIQVIVGLRPLGQLRRQLMAVRAGASSSIEGDFPTEVQPLVDEFNAVLALNAQVVSRARTQAGNLAHAVKTPLSVLANAAEKLDTDFARLVGEQTAAAQRQVDHHLVRARAAAMVQAPGVRTPVAGVLAALIRVMHRLHVQSGLQIQCDTEEGLAFRGDEQDLHEMLGNLLDNACKWAKQRVVVSVRSGPPDSPDDHRMLVFTIDDDGKGLELEQRDRIFSRGVRADERAPGSGLGLAIVRDLAELYGGSVCVDESPLGGLRAVLCLPAT